MTIIAFLLVAYAVLVVFCGPFVIGEETRVTALSYVTNLVLAAMWILVSGRVLGWW